MTLDRDQIRREAESIIELGHAHYPLTNDNVCERVAHHCLALLTELEGAEGRIAAVETLLHAPAHAHRMLTRKEIYEAMMRAP